MRLIDSQGNQLGVLKTSEALSRAEEEGLDLIEIAPEADPPVAKLVDWGKYQYEKTKLAQKAKKKQKTTEVKQIRFGLKIDDHDLDVKLRKVREFLEKGHKVKISAYFKGREMAHKELGYALLERVAEMLEDVADTDQEPQFAGRQLTMSIRRKQ